LWEGPSQMVKTRKRTRENGYENRSEDKSIKVQSRNGEDLLSTLPDDILRDIFSRGDHTDLDEIATLSRRLNKLSAVKIEASELTISQLTEKRFQFSITLNDEQEYLLNMAPGSRTKFRKNGKAVAIKDHYITTQQHTITSVIANRAAVILKRFTFRNIEFYSICIDDNLIQFLERIIVTRSLTTFREISCVFDKKLKSDGKSRFLSALLSGKPDEIVLDFSGQNQCITQHFLEEYSRLVMLPSFFLAGDYDSHTAKVSLVNIDDDFAQSLSQFGRLHAPRLVLHIRSGECLVSQTLIRLRFPNAGEWRFKITTNIDKSQFETAFEPDMKCTQTVQQRALNVFSIEVKGTPQKVEIQIFPAYFDS
ncbi:hypothetical protein PENTCL1PPCAC_1093, partial [Pristionchus entomophagus]